MGISAANKYLLNRYSGSLGGKIQLGTIIEEAGGVAADEITLAEGKVLIGNASGVAEAQTASGDATISAAGVVAIAAGAIVNADVNASAAIAFSKLAALPSAQVLVGNGSNVATAVAVTGDVTISNAGVTAIGTGVVVSADLASGIAYSHRVIAAGKHTTAGGDATEVITATGALATDVAIVITQAGNSNVLQAVPGTDNITVTLSADPGADDVLAWLVLRVNS